MRDARRRVALDRAAMTLAPASTPAASIHGSGGQRRRPRHARHQRRRLLPAGVDPRHAGSGGALTAPRQLVAALVRATARASRDGAADLRLHAAAGKRVRFRLGRPVDPDHRRERRRGREPSLPVLRPAATGHGRLRGGPWLRGLGGLARITVKRRGRRSRSPGRRFGRAPASLPSRRPALAPRRSATRHGGGGAHPAPSS